MTLKEALDASYPPYFIYGKVLSNQIGSFRLEQSLDKNDEVYVDPSVIQQIYEEREEVLKMLWHFAQALKKANPLAVDLLLDQKIED